MTIQQCYMHIVKGKDADGKDTKDVQYWTGKDGKGKQVHRPISGGGGKYFVKSFKDDPDTMVLTDAEIQSINQKAFKFHMADSPLAQPKKVGKKVITHRKGLLHRFKDVCANMRNKVSNLSSEKYGACLTEAEAAYMIDFVYKQADETKAAILKALGKESGKAEEVITLG